MSKANEWRMVPAEPTLEQLEAMTSTWHEYWPSEGDPPYAEDAAVYRAALAAAPPAEQMPDEQARTRALNEAITTLERRFMGDLNREDMEVRRCIDALIALRDSTP